MTDTRVAMHNLQVFGVGRRVLGDELFSCDAAPARFGIYDNDEEDLCHEIVRLECTVPGCVFTASYLLELENHYNTCHRYCCEACRRVLPSPHLLDLHIQETHDSYFAVMAARKPSYCCYIQECTNKFINTEERLDHCINIHKLPKDFRFEIKPRVVKRPNKSKPQNIEPAMDVDAGNREPQKIFLHNSKRKGLPKYSGQKFTSEKNKKSSIATNMDEIMLDLKEYLPK